MRRPVTDHPRCTTPPGDWYLRLQALRRRQVTARLQIDLVRAKHTQVSIQNSGNRLRQNGISDRVAVTPPCLTI